MIEKLVNLLGIENLNGDEYRKLQIIVEIVTNRLLLRIGRTTLPQELEYIVIEIAIARFNRIGSEGLTSHHVAEEVMAFLADDFAAYESDIKMWLGVNGYEDVTMGRMRFL